MRYTVSRFPLRYSQKSLGRVCVCRRSPSTALVKIPACVRGREFQFICMREDCQWGRGSLLRCILARVLSTRTDTGTATSAGTYTATDADTDTCTKLSPPAAGCPAPTQHPICLRTALATPASRVSHTYRVLARPHCCPIPGSSSNRCSRVGHDMRGGYVVGMRVCVNACACTCRRLSQDSATGVGKVSAVKMAHACRHARGGAQHNRRHRQTLRHSHTHNLGSFATCRRRSPSILAASTSLADLISATERVSDCGSQPSMLSPAPLDELALSCPPATLNPTP